MNATVPLPVFTAEDMSTRFGEALEAAGNRPVGISCGDQLLAYLVSKQDLEQLFTKIEELEDQLWLKEAELGRQSGFIDAGEVETFMSDVGKSNHGEARDSE